jgi:hypothetical protein
VGAWLCEEALGYLAETEEKGQVAVDAVLLLEHARSLDTLPGRGDLDENAVFGDAQRLVEFDEVDGLFRRIAVSKGRVV